MATAILTLRTGFLDCDKTAECGRSVLFFLYTLDGGGAERVASQLCNIWASAGVRVILVTIQGISRDDYVLDQRVVRIAMNIGAPARNPLDTIFANLRRVEKLRRIIRKHKPDVVLSFITEANVVAILAARAANTRVVVSERGYPPLTVISRIWATMRKVTYRFADTIVVQTSAVEHWVARECKVKHIHVIPNTVSLPLPSEQPVIHAHDVVPPDQKILLTVARLHVEKGIDRLIQSFAAVSNKHTGWNLVICGEGEERDKLQALVDNLELGCRTHLIGKVGNIQHWYENAHLFALTSQSEGFPNALLEAMACGCVPLSFDCEAGPRDIIRNGVDGVLVADQDVTALSDAMNKLMSDEPLRKQLSLRAKDVLNRFDTDDVTPRWNAILWP